MYVQIKVQVRSIRYSGFKTVLASVVLSASVPLRCTFRLTLCTCSAFNES